MDFFGLGKLWSTLIVAGAAIASAAVIYAWITTAAYNRGVAATVHKMQVLIGAGKARVEADVNKLKTLPEDQLDAELKRLCELHKAPGQTCAP